MDVRAETAALAVAVAAIRITLKERLAQALQTAVTVAQDISVLAAQDKEQRQESLEKITQHFILAAAEAIILAYITQMAPLASPEELAAAETALMHMAQTQRKLDM